MHFSGKYDKIYKISYPTFVGFSKLVTLTIRKEPTDPMTNLLLKQLTSLVEFLGKALGPDYEITLHDLDPDNCVIAAIANGRISGRNVGARLSARGAMLLEKKEYESADYSTNQTALLANGKTIRASTLFIKNETDTPVAMLCINFDDSRFRAINYDLMGLIHPNHFLEQHYSIRASDLPQLNTAPAEKKNENIHNDVSDLMKDIYEQVSRNVKVPMDRLTQEERTDVIAQLNDLGMFRLKGAVQFVADGLGCSQASIYRYLSKVKYS